MSRFDRFLAIDWSGAVGERHRGIALAMANAAGGAPASIQRQQAWSRPDVLAMLRDLPDDTLVGMDLGTALPFIDCGSYFPGLADSPSDARTLWALADEVCAPDPHLAASSFVDHPDFAPYFRKHGGREGTQFGCDGAAHGKGRFRVTEQRQAVMGCKPYSNFNLVGAAQVGKASLTGMRVLHRLAGRVPVWPMDPLPDAGSVIVEIYTTIAAMAARRSPSRAKMRTLADLNAALANLDTPPVPGEGAIDDHSADALLAAAWLRKAADEPAFWNPPMLSASIAQTEGWTFGAI